MERQRTQKRRKPLLSVYGSIIITILVCTLGYGLLYNGGGANVLMEEEKRIAEEEAAAIIAAAPTPTPQTVVISGSGRLIPYMANNLWGYKNTSGEIVILPAYSTAKEFEGNVAFAAQNGLYGLINRSGAWITEPTWSNVSSFSEGYAGVEQDGKWGFIDQNGNVVINYSYR
ncbi:MAG: WG repeat-containing protein, partial [Clostridia bacterium]|nr:WG repeat-containing protein [Clostridia bacterium]